MERVLGQGRVIQFSVPLHVKALDEKTSRPWHNYFSQSSFGIVLVDRVCKYLAGDAVDPELNYFAGVPPLVVPPPPPLAGPYTLHGPELAAAETNLAFNENGEKLAVAQATVPGNYLVKDAKDRSVAGFSVNVRPEESQLDRIPVTDFDAVWARTRSCRRTRKNLERRSARALGAAPGADALAHDDCPRFLVIESLLANRFYRVAGIRH